MTHSEVLSQVYEQALKKTAVNDLSTDLPENVKKNIEFIVARSEGNKAIATVLMTLLTHKVVEPTQDMRNHQAKLPNGFCRENHRSSECYSIHEREKFSFNGRIGMAYTVT